MKHACGDEVRDVFCLRADRESGNALRGEVFDMLRHQHNTDGPCVRCELRRMLMDDGPLGVPGDSFRRAIRSGFLHG